MRRCRHLRDRGAPSRKGRPPSAPIDTRRLLPRHGGAVVRRGHSGAAGARPMRQSLRHSGGSPLDGRGAVFGRPPPVVYLGCCRAPSSPANKTSRYACEAVRGLRGAARGLHPRPPGGAPARPLRDATRRARLMFEPRLSALGCSCARSSVSEEGTEGPCRSSARASTSRSRPRTSGGRSHAGARV
jgi:hypothetical protein